MVKIMITACLSLGLLCGTAFAQSPSAPNESETSLRHAVEAAAWPADIVRLADGYLARYPDGQAAAQVRTLARQAALAAQVLDRREVRLYRSAFQLEAVTPAVAEDIRRAAVGDREAAFRLAHAYQHGSHGAPKEAKRYVGWLQYAALLGQDQAAYELAVYFREQDQPALASRYEAQALALNHLSPTALDHVRK